MDKKQAEKKRLSEAVVGDLRKSLERLGLSAEQQLALLPESGDEADAAVAVAAERRFPSPIGRPKGTVNRATRQLRAYLLANFTDPAIGLASTGLCSTLEASVIKARALAKALGCKTLEALALMRQCSADLMPYTHSKQPLAVQLNGKIAALHIGLGMDGSARAGGEALAELLDGIARAGTEAAVELALADLDDEENAAESNG